MLKTFFFVADGETS